MNTLRTILRDSVSGLMVLVGGIWRDRTGLTRPLILFALLGETSSAIVVLLGSYFWSLSPWVPAGIEGAIVGLTGGRHVFSMATICYLTDRTSEENRTNRSDDFYNFFYFIYVRTK